jgi:hypothetical protein
MNSKVRKSIGISTWTQNACVRASGGWWYRFTEFDIDDIDDIDNIDDIDDIDDRGTRLAFSLFGFLFAGAGDYDQRVSQHS